MEKSVILQGTPSQLRQSVLHAATLYRTQAEERPLGFRMNTPTALANPGLAVELGAQRLQSIDQTVTVEIDLFQTGSQVTLRLSTRTPLYYMTHALGFEDDVVNSLMSTIQNTLSALRNSTKLPTFPAPPRPPKDPS